NKEAVAKLFKEIAPRFAERPGGYKRIIRRQERRLGDAGETAYIELLRAGETRTRAPGEPAVHGPPRTGPPPATHPQQPPHAPPRMRHATLAATSPPDQTPPAGKQKPQENPPAQ